MDKNEENRGHRGSKMVKKLRLSFIRVSVETLLMRTYFMDVPLRESDFCAE